MRSPRGRARRARADRPGRTLRPAASTAGGLERGRSGAPKPGSDWTRARGPKTDVDLKEVAVPEQRSQADQREHERYRTTLRSTGPNERPGPGAGVRGRGSATKGSRKRAASAEGYSSGAIHSDLRTCTAPFGVALRSGAGVWIEDDGVRRSRRDRVGRALFGLPMRAISGGRSLLLLLVLRAASTRRTIAFHVVVSRLLGPSDYGALAALLAVVLVLSVPFAVLQTARRQPDGHAAARVGREHEDRPAARRRARSRRYVALRVGDRNRRRARRRRAASEPLPPRRYLRSTLLLAPYVVASVPAQRGTTASFRENSCGSSALARRLGLRAAWLLRFVLGVTLVWRRPRGLGRVARAPSRRDGADRPAGRVRLIACRPRARGGAAKRIAPRVFAADVGTALWGLTSFWLLAEVDVALARHYLECRRRPASTRAPG